MPPDRSDESWRDGASPLGEFLALRDALSAAVHRPVDLVIEGSVCNPFIRAGIQRSAETVYGS
jgi:predicted nucleotidyltransferase